MLLASLLNYTFPLVSLPGKWLSFAARAPFTLAESLAPLMIFTRPFVAITAVSLITLVSEASLRDSFLITPTISLKDFTYFS